MSPYLGVEAVESSVLAFGAAASLTAALLVLVPLGLAIALLSRASRRLRPAAGTLRRASPNELAGLQTELRGNYDRLRRSGEAVPLATDLWRRFSHAGEAMPLAVRREVAQAYHAIEVSNRLLTASAAYDSRGVLSIRQRRLALWPTLETAIRGALSALGCQVTPAIQVRTRPATEVEATARPAARSASPAEPALAARKDKAMSSTLGDPPRLSLFCGAEAGLAASRSATGRRAAANTTLRSTRGKARPRTRARAAARKRPVRPALRFSKGPSRSHLDGQMALWESVA